MSNRYEHNIIPKSTAPNSPHTPVDVSMMTHYSSAGSVNITGEGYYVGAYGNAWAYSYNSSGNSTSTTSVIITVTIDGVSVPSLAESSTDSLTRSVYSSSQSGCSSMGGMYPFSNSLVVSASATASGNLDTNASSKIYYWM